ncbi:hypothetical protein HZA57_09040 [Candidatus Poribacteria bacterium]|nr:hypothetical protein [Candidatus Poribacteria bacterium]
MAAGRIPITELANPLTTDIDLAEPVGIARYLRQSDAQLTAGWMGYPSLLDAEVHEVCARAALDVAEAVEAGTTGAVLISGAGTSGRFAILICRAFNRILRNAHKPEVFVPLLAGGPAAMIQAREGAEDDPAQAVRDVNAALPAEIQRAVYFGVTCGFSAPYVAGQLDFLRERPGVTSVLVGFNAPNQVRSTPIEGWNKTFADVVASRRDSENFLLIAPVHGPEAIMGSTRLKGATATKVILESICTTALEMAGCTSPEAEPTPPSGRSVAAAAVKIRECILRCREALQAVYARTDLLGELIRAGGAALRAGGQISYLGRDTGGILGIIDAAECPPTFGAEPNDVRGFVRSGWPELLDEQKDFTHLGDMYACDHDTFEKKRLPKLAKGDLVLGVAIGEIGPNTGRLLTEAARTRAAVACLLVGPVGPKPADLPEGLQVLHFVEIPELGFHPGFHNIGELALKVCLNALTTGAHILAGKVFHNQMIDLRISNQKLYFRALDTIRKLVGVAEEDARRALHRAIWRMDELEPEQILAPPSAAIKAATGRPRSVPAALRRAAKPDLSIEDAVQLLAMDPVVRRTIEKQLSQD